MALSPMMKHYFEIKENYKDCIVFYRLGDFYEMFFDDAKKASEMLELTLTGRDCGLEERAPMCGVPYHAADTYISKLVSMGEKVAICEQLTEPNGKELVEREVVRVVTAGTVTNNELIDEKSNNFICSVFLDEKYLSMAWADITTGEFYVMNFNGENAYKDFFDEIVKISPAEIIASANANEKFAEMPLVKNGFLPRFHIYADSNYNFDFALSLIKEQFNVASLQMYRIQDKVDCVCASGALISYLKETQKHALKNLIGIKYLANNDYMSLDANAIRNLELVKTMRDGSRRGSLLWLLDKTKTNMGARLIQSWILSPLNDIDKINYRLDGVNAFYKNTLIRQALAELLRSVKDIGRLTGKISNGNLMPKDCLALSNSLEVLPSIIFQLSGTEANIVKDAVEKVADFSETVKLLRSAISENAPTNLKDGGYIKNGYNKNLDEFRSLSKNSKSIIAEIENKERIKTGIKTLRIGYNRVFGYYIEVTNSFKNSVPYEYQRRQTLTNAERYITEELKEVEYKVLSSDEQALRLENELYNQIKDYLSGLIEELQNTADAVALIDALISLASVARENNYVMPEVLESGKPLEIVDGRHPVVELLAKERFVPNDCFLDNSDNRTMVITGPNMAGKSTFMRQTALIVLMAHIGSFVPAKVAKIPITDKIFTRIGASDNLILEQSTFMVEMTEVADILLNATENSLLILDEIGRGTSTFDGLSIAWAVIEYITKTVKAKTLFATHFHELTELEGVLEGVKNYKVTVKELQGGIVFLRKIMRGGTNKSFGIEVARIAGVPQTITDSAKTILKKLEKADLTKGNSSSANAEEKVKSEAERILLDININDISPMQAFNILSDLVEKVKGE